MDDDDDILIISPIKNKPSSFLTTKKTTTKQQLPRLKSDKLEVGDALRGAHMECPICRKNLESLSEIRRAVHVNTCVDASVNKKAVEEAAKEAQTMFTCSFCNETVAKGPYLIAHANKCAKTFDMPVSKMVTALETQAQVAEKLRRNGFNKAAPVTTEMIQRAKKRVLEEQEAAKNSSDTELAPPLKKSTSSSRKFTSGLLKSTVFGKKEKHICRCEGLHLIQNRFCGQFKRKKEPCQDDINNDLLEKNIFRKKLEKIDRLSRLADDFRRALFSQKTDIKICTKDGLSISAHTFVLKARTSLDIKANATEISLTDFSSEVVEMYLLYLYSGATDWSLNDMEDIRKLATLYGPSDLHLMMTHQDEDVLDIRDDEDVMAKHDSDDHMNAQERDNDLLISTHQNEATVFYQQEEINGTIMNQQEEIMVTHQGDEDAILKQHDNNIIMSPFNANAEVAQIFTPPSLTLSAKTRRIAARLGSGVKVIKVYDVTPMPSYEKYTDDELKAALNAFGIRPLGRKKAIEMLKNIYDEVHPFVPDLSTATPKRRPSPIPFDLDQAETSNGSHSSHDNNDDILNESMEDNPEESLYFDADDTIGPSSGSSPTKGLKRINDVETATKAMLEWLRLPENDELYSNLLAYRTVNLDELMGTIGRSSHPVQKITKKILPDVLDKLYIGFYVPDKKWKRRAGYKSG